MVLNCRNSLPLGPAYETPSLNGKLTEMGTCNITNTIPLCHARKKKGRSDHFESDGLFQEARFLRHSLNVRARFSGEPPSLSDRRCFLKAACVGLKDLTPSPALSRQNLKAEPVPKGR